MNLIYPILSILILFAIALAIAEKLGFLTSTEPKIYPFEKKPNFLILSEQAFFQVLLQITNNQYFIFPQIHLASILKVKTGEFDKRGWRRYFNRLIQKSFDFVIFDKQNLQPLLVIELDDSTHEQYKRKLRDSFVDKILEAANLKILHVKPGYNRQELEKNIVEVVSEGKYLVINNL